MDGRRVRAATAISRAWRRRAPAKSRKLSRFYRWTPPKYNNPGGKYRFTRITSSNSTGTTFGIATDALGVPKFFVGTANNADNMQIDFSLQQTVIRLGGTSQIVAVAPDYAEFTALFDQWCIDKVELFLIPTYTNAGVSGTVQLQAPTIVHALDDDDSAAASKLILQQYGNARYTQLVNNVGDPQPIRVFRPKPAIAAYQTGATFAYGELTRGPKWIDVAYPTVPHYSFKAALDYANATGDANTRVCYIDIVAKYHYRFKTVR